MLSYDDIKRLVQDSNPGVSEGELFATTQRVWEGALSAYVYRVNHPDPDIRNDRSPIVVVPGDDPAPVQAVDLSQAPASAPVAAEPPSAPIAAQAPAPAVAEAPAPIAAQAPVQVAAQASPPINQGAPVTQGV